MKSRTSWKTLFHTTKDFKGTVAIAELRRAHVIIVLLSLSLTFLLVAAGDALQLDKTMVIIVAALLVLNALISALIAIALGRR